MSTPSSPGRLGLIAGQGELVAIAADHLREEGHKVYAVGFDDDTRDLLAGRTEGFKRLRLGQLGKLIEFFLRHEIREVIMIGKVQKTNMFRNLRPDLRALHLWKTILDRRDDTILKALVAELGRDGISVGRTDRYFRHLLVPPGKLSKRKPDRRELADGSFGWKLAKAVGRLDLGQTVVVKNMAPVAVEAIEGTDKTILRAGELAGPGAVVVKVSKPQQDFRFDVPVVGLETVKSLVAARISALFVETGKALFVQREESLSLLTKHRIAFWGCRSRDFQGKA